LLIQIEFDTVVHKSFNQGGLKLFRRKCPPFFPFADLKIDNLDVNQKFRESINNHVKILLLSAYDAASHHYWREGLVHAFPEYDWTVLSLPPRHFNWRLRGNSLSWGFSAKEQLTGDYDLLVTTSMTDLSALRGFVPSLSRLPTIVYFHENQFAYPDSGSQFPSIEPQMLNLYTALAADRLVFNSANNRDSFLEGGRELLRKMPDFVPSGLVEKLSQVSSVIPVPTRTDLFPKLVTPEIKRPFTIVWNHRWEYDKAPERLLGALRIFQESGIDYKIHIIGQQFRSIPPVFDEIRSELDGIIGEWGFIKDDGRYREVLTESHVVVSTALHDFQGLAVLEAVVAGCVPLAPDRLAYPELIPKDFLYLSHLDDPVKEQKALANCLIDLARKFEKGNMPPPPDLSHLSWTNLKPQYQTIIKETVNLFV